MLLANRRVIFLAAHGETLDQGRLPKPTADSSSDDKTILRESAPAQLAAGSLQEYSRGRAQSPPAELWEPEDSYIRAWGWGEPRGLGLLPGPGKSSHSQRHVHTPAADEHSCMPFPGLEWASPFHCHHRTLQTPFSSHLLQEALPEALPLPGTRGCENHVAHEERVWGLQVFGGQVTRHTGAGFKNKRHCRGSHCLDSFHEALQGRTGTQN